MLALRPAQERAGKEIATQSTLLVADVGSGKTATALLAISIRAAIYGKQRTLVLGTKRICSMVWGPEITAWLPSYTYASAAGYPADKRKAIMLDKSIDIVGLNFDNLIWAIETFGGLLPVLFPQLVIDESSKLENPRAKSFKAIRPVLNDFAWRLPMTGTPRANHLHDLWGNVYLADMGKALGEYKDGFLQYWFYPVHRTQGIEWIPRGSSEAEIYERLQHYKSVHRMAFDWHDPVELDVVIPLNHKVKVIQGKINAALKAGDTEVEIDGVTYVRNGKRVSAKMLQLSSGFVYSDDKKADAIHLHNDKLDALQEIVDEAKGEPIMVVYSFEHERDAILERFPQACLLDDGKILSKWNSGQIEILLVHPLSCGHGLNAQFSGCDLQVWFSPTHDAELYGQTAGRLNRPGNPKTIRVLRLIMQGTKDRAAYQVVAARQRGENVTLGAFE